MDEVWKQVVGYEGLYEVSSLGRVRSSYCSPRKKAGECLRSGNLRGYRTVVLCKEKVRYTALVHRLVAIAFLGEPPAVERPTVNHKNLDKADNRVENLEWMSHADNNRHAAPMIPRLKGEQVHRRKLTDEQVRSIRDRYIPHVVSLSDLASEYGVSQQTIHSIVHRRKWKHI